MNAIIGMSTIGQLKAGDVKGMQDCFRKIDSSSRYLLSLINDILDMSKIENGKMNLSQEYFDFAGLIEDLSLIHIYPTAKKTATQMMKLTISPPSPAFRDMGIRVRTSRLPKECRRRWMMPAMANAHP